MQTSKKEEKRWFKAKVKEKRVKVSLKTRSIISHVLTQHKKEMHERMSDILDAAERTVAVSHVQHASHVQRVT